ncbi:hypothetical protein GOODEAATRI_013974 [Goodea atripinnis]|uniref:GPCR family 2 latrophilin C-terminal domain-containing protein n=1 Tax=Goodea atripinnis TaxID=208336 RepID=A0ABV0NAU5_9TELE
MWNDTVRRQTESSFIAADVNNTPTLNRGEVWALAFLSGGVSQSQESCALDSVCLNGGYTSNTFTLHGLGTTPGSRAGVVGSADLLREGGVGLGGDDISPGLLTPHGSTDMNSGAGLHRNLSDAAALEKMIISELVQSNLRPSGPMPVPPERYGSLARPHHNERPALTHTATLTRHPQPPQEGWSAMVQPSSRQNAQEGWAHVRQPTQDTETNATTHGQDHATTPRLQDGWSHGRISGDSDTQELLKDGDRSQLQGTLGRRGHQERLQARPPDVQARPYSTLSRTPGTLTRHRSTKDRALDVWRGGIDLDSEESFSFENKDGGLDGRIRGKDRGSLRYHGERQDSDSFTLPLTPDLDLDPDSSPIYTRDSNPSPLYPGDRCSPPLNIFSRNPPPTNIFAPREDNSPPDNLYSRHSPQVYSRSGSPPRFYTRTSPPTHMYPDSSPEGPEEVSPTSVHQPQRPTLELPYSLGRPPLGPRPNHLQTFYQPPPLASNGETGYSAESTSDGDDGQMQRVTSL